jgi:HEXXH motif-containing protein
MTVALDQLAALGPATRSLRTAHATVLARRVFLAERLLAPVPGGAELRAAVARYWTLPGEARALLAREPLFSHGVGWALYHAATGSLPPRAAEYAGLLDALVLDVRLRAGAGFPLGEPVTVHGVTHRLELPNHPGYVRLRPVPPDGRLRVVADGSGVRASTGSGEAVELDLAAFRRAAADTVLPGGLRLESGPWYRHIGGKVIDRAVEAEATPGAGPAGSPFLDPADMAVTAHFARALRILRDAAPAAFAEVQAHSAVVVPIRTPFATGFTVDTCRGAVFVTPEDSVIDTIDHLVHESAHNKLHTIEDLNPLLLPMDGELFVSPWRTDPRPMSGLVHGAYVFTLVGFALAQIAGTLPEAATAIRERVTIYQDQVAQALETIDRHARLTPAGAEFVRFLRRWHAELVGTPRPASRPAG